MRRNIMSVDATANCRSTPVRPSAGESKTTVGVACPPLPPSKHRQPATYNSEEGSAFSRGGAAGSDEENVVISRTLYVEGIYSDTYGSGRSKVLLTLVQAIRPYAAKYFVPFG